MKVVTVKTYKFDLEKERKRLNKCFKGEQLKRQLDILEAFEKREFLECVKLITALPECPKSECSEQEYTGMEIVDFLQDAQYGNFDCTLQSYFKNLFKDI